MKKEENTEGNDDKKPEIESLGDASCSADCRKAYHVATAVSSIVGSEHGWEDESVGEYNLANAFREYASSRNKSPYPATLWQWLKWKATKTAPFGSFYLAGLWFRDF